LPRAEAARRPAAAKNRWTVAVSNDLAGLKCGLDALETWLVAHDVEPETENRARLVFEEIVSNITRYGFADGRKHQIGIAGALGKRELTLVFDDTGRPFDPRKAAAPQAPATLADAAIGGRGLLLVRTAASRLDYERTADGHNRLTVVLARH
jgi:anti-sigma regulatory factor (Ser/Thr protein kinase)